MYIRIGYFRDSADFFKILNCSRKKKLRTTFVMNLHDKYINANKLIRYYILLLLKYIFRAFYDQKLSIFVKFKFLNWLHGDTENTRDNFTQTLRVYFYNSEIKSNIFRTLILFIFRNQKISLKITIADLSFREERF